MSNVHKEEYKGFTIRILHDDDATSPAEWDQFGTIYTRHNRYFAIGEDLNKLEGPEIADEIRSEGGELLPIYAYVHGGVALSTGSFSCPWDSGQCGFIAVTKAKLIEEYSDDSEASREKARKLMAAEIENWNTYFSGEVYGYIVETEDGDELDSCWGFYGDYDEVGGALLEGRSIADWHVEQRSKKRMEKLKSLIRNRTPLHLREKALEAIA